ncbi:MAG: hypothetical protein KI792_03445 [Alphaproteobacteria bacterium]|nr:hypothetical protein [Alphaproteobacteria bacterium SS10]
MSNNPDNSDPFGDGPPEDDAPGSYGVLTEIPRNRRSQFLDDGASIPDHGQVVMPAVLVLPHGLGPQLRGAEMISPLASHEEIWRGRNYPATDPKTQSHNRLYVNEETGEIEVDRNGIARIDTLVLNDDEPIDPKPGMKNLSVQAIDEQDRVWALDLRMAEGRRGAIAKEVAEIAKRGGMIILQPELFERNSGSMDGFIAIDPKAVPVVSIYPNEESGWVMELKRGKGDGVLFEFSSGAKALDAMAYTVSQLGRSVDYATVTSLDADGAEIEHSMFTAEEAGRAKADMFDNHPERPEISIMLYDHPAQRSAANDALPGQVEGVGLNPNWLSSIARLDNRVSAVTRLAEIAVYPNGRGQPHPMDKPDGPKTDEAEIRRDLGARGRLVDKKFLY